MEVKFKRFKIISHAECDDNSGVWNGRFRILDEKGVVAYEICTEPQSDQKEAYEAAKQSALEWVDSQ